MQPIVHIVDDDPSVRASISFLLRSHDCVSEIYSSAEEFFRDARFGLGCILLDVRMPGMDGFAAQAELIRRGVDLPVIFMSGHGDVPSAVRAVKLGAFDFLEKPFREGVLLPIVQQACALSMRDQQRRAQRSEAVARLARLSTRETQILRGLLAGMTNKEIARRFEISPRTVEMHRANMMRDMNCDALSDVIRLAIEAELEPLDRASPPQHAAGEQRDLAA
ncbi:response regulator transcription factor [Sphingomonas parva]|uniref:Response regulator transcription factor n=1 Tax=Sphingomonas parva TaxID=2555898 RepID=A0A4Y8ZPM3_9SPHN|nr:response regulator [Sphingomonas parva]TFI57085.1 response regulator transcription factor [Sphingomonas parva]